MRCAQGQRCGTSAFGHLLWAADLKQLATESEERRAECGCGWSSVECARSSSSQSYYGGVCMCIPAGSPLWLDGARHKSTKPRAASAAKVESRRPGRLWPLYPEPPALLQHALIRTPPPTYTPSLFMHAVVRILDPTVSVTLLRPFAAEGDLRSARKRTRG